jgi:hypothetical protein
VVATVCAKRRKHPDTAVIDQLFLEIKSSSLRLRRKGELQMQVPIADIDVPVFDRYIDAVSRAAGIVQVA